MTQIKIQDDSGDRRYFTQIPNYIANHSTANDQALYFQMKRFAGEDGQCFATQETLMAKLGIGRKAFNKSLDYLLTREWVRYIGTSKGKTHPIKTYSIVDIWKLNIMEYEKIEAKSTVSFENEKDTRQKEKDTGQKNSKIQAERTVEEEPILRRTNEEDNTAETSSANLIPEVIKLFEGVNPANKKFYNNTTQRKAVENLLDEYGFEEVSQVIAFLPRANKTPYLPTITTPAQLWDRYQALKDGIAKNKGVLTAKGRGLEI